MKNRKKDKKQVINKVKTFTVPLAQSEINNNITLTPNIQYQINLEKIVNQALQLHSQGNIEDAAKYYKYIIDEGYNDFRVFSNLGVILNGIGKSKDAELLLRKAIELAPSAAPPKFALARLLLEQRKSLLEALELAETVNRLTPKPEHYQLWLDVKNYID